MRAEPYDREGIAQLLDRERLVVIFALMATGDIGLAAQRLDVPRADLVDALRRWNRPANTTAHWRRIDLEEAA